MLFGKPELYERARQAKLGRSDLSGPLEELRLWVNSRYSINVLDTVYDLIDIGPHEGRPRLNLIIETTQDHDALRKDRFTIKPSIKKSILKAFSKIVTSSNSNSKFNTENVHLITDDFSEEAMGRAVGQFLDNHTDAIVKEYPKANIWDISGFSTQIVVFYYKEIDISKNQKNGQSKIVRQTCFEKTKQYDEFNYLTLSNFSFRFDSKENLDKNYAGSLFYYWR